ncbi:DUF6887 family protein [Floridanema evergladense]|uniref:Uncharacterized protein n=1 Tax=Floridaenema evergladense BLCC-F167 TaxID=3153639 RepID=A0ABV4WP22_9CYAN
MSTKPNFEAMTKHELRTYILEHREDEKALHAYLDKLHTENPNPRIYNPEENVADAVSEYLKQRQNQES